MCVVCSQFLKLIVVTRQSAMAAPGVDRMRSSMKNLEGNVRTMLSEIDANTLMMKLVAEDLERDNNNAAVSELKDATLQIIGFADQLRNHCSALQSLSTTYQPSHEVTDFEMLLTKKMQELKAAAPSDPANHQFFKQFNEAVWNVNHSGQPMPGQEQDEMVMMNGQWGVLNPTCPLSGKPVTELTKPVRSMDCRHVFEHAAVLDHIMRHRANHRRRPCPCAAAGCPKPLVQANLVCDASLLVEIQELRLRARNSQTQQQVADYTELEED